MAEYGILIWRTGKVVGAPYYPNEFDLILNLDVRNEFVGKAAGDLMKVEKSKGILKTPGNVIMPEFDQTLAVERVGPKVKTAKSDIVLPTFIDKCIARISDKTKQEELSMAIERVKYDPRQQEVTYRYVGSFLRSFYLTQCEMIAYKNILQTVYIDRIGVCEKRFHLEGVDRLLSQMQVLNLLECSMAKVCKNSDKSFVDLTNVEDSNGYHAFAIEIGVEKLQTTKFNFTSKQTLGQIYKDVQDLENDNAAKRLNHYLTETENDDNKNMYADFEEEISEMLKDVAQIKQAMTLYGAQSRFFHEMKIIVWKISNGTTAKGLIHNADNWSDLVRLPMRNFGIWSLIFSPLNQYFGVLYSIKSLKILQQPEKKQNEFWSRWMKQIRYRNEDHVNKILKFAYGAMEKGCDMEQVIMFNYFETIGFLYNLVGRVSCVQVRERLYHGIFHKKGDMPTRWSPEKRKTVKRSRGIDCDAYLENNYVFKGWEGSLLEDVRDCMSISCAFIYILRFAFGLDRKKLDPDEIESDMNMVLMGHITLEVFLERYIPTLSNLVSKAQSCDSTTSLSDMLQLLYCHNLLYVLLALFGEVSFERMNHGGYLIFKRYMRDSYLLTHVKQKPGHITTLKGLQLSELCLYMMSGPTCAEYSYDYYDPFENYDNEIRNNAWGEHMVAERLRIYDEKDKYGEKAEEWDQQQQAALREKKRQADYRYEIRNFIKILFRDANYNYANRSLNLKVLTQIHCSRVNYSTMNIFLGMNCRGVSDITTVVFPVSAPHKSLMVVTIYTKGMEVAEILAKVEKRFRRNFENIYQHVLIGIGPSDVTFTTGSDELKTKDRVVYKGIGPMTTKMIPYTSEDVDAQAILVKSDKVTRGSKFFFMKVSAAE
ncbi:VP2 [CHeRI orbivirus 2-1]|nr:VP2 [CHeRI orbivirus 2-1]